MRSTQLMEVHQADGVQEDEYNTSYEVQQADGGITRLNEGKQLVMVHRLVEYNRLDGGKTAVEVQQVNGVQQLVEVLQLMRYTAMEVNTACGGTMLVGYSRLMEVQQADGGTQAEGVTTSDD
eukprot:gene32044-16577_t